MSAPNKLADLNNHLFETLERLNDDELMELNPEEIQRARAIAEIGKVIVANGKLVLDAHKYGSKQEDRNKSLPPMLSNE